MIDRLLNESKLWVCTRTDDPWLFLVEYNERTWQMLYDDVSLQECKCNERSGIALPCCRLNALFKQLINNTFRAQLIIPRWIPNFDRFAVFELPQLMLKQPDFIQKIFSEVSSDDEHEDPPPKSPGKSDLIRVGRDSNTRKYADA
jgi:hypothetical protein